MLASVNFYKSATKAIGDAKAARSLRLFMVPGMGHCGGGEGPNTFRHDGAARTVGREGAAADARRRLAQHERQSRSDASALPVPEVARYTGSGSTDEAENFTCRLP